MNDAEFNRLLGNATRRNLSADEAARLQACFQEDPSAKAAWEEEMALSQLLQELPDAPLATNFTTRVLQTVEREARRPRWRAPKIFRWSAPRRPAPQIAGALLAVILLAVGYWQYQSLQRRKMADSLARVANNLVTVSDVTSLPPVEIWRDFDAINRLPPPADEQLLTALDVALE